MPRKRTHKNDKYFLITVSDKRGTRHFKAPKLIKSAAIGTGLVLIFALTAGTVLVFKQAQQIQQARAQASSLEDTLVKLSSKNIQLGETLLSNQEEKKSLSNTLSRLEQISGISSNIDASLLARLTHVSESLAVKQKNFYNGYVDSNMQDKENLASDSDTGQKQSGELADLDVNQQKLLHDSIPNGEPTNQSGIINGFGERINPDNRQLSYNNGVDLDVAAGIEVYATADAIVKQVSHSNTNGGQIVLSHNLGFESRYAPLSELKVEPGEVVQKGDIIGLSGKQKEAHKALLHYEVRYLDKPFDPVDFINWEFGSNTLFKNVRGIRWQSLISLINKQISTPTLQLSQAAQ